ncbi:hypothetical protein HMI55_003780 [Coelomomyces lativittatus]|nr:hypothetical protein HMI55_003780 [Coelomomyces lativittatus]
MVLTNIKVLARPSSAQKETMVDPTPSPLPSSKLYTNYVAKQDPSMTNSFEELTLNEEIEYIPGTLSIQLLDKTGKLRTSDLKKLLKDHPNSLVIGVFGRSGLGKSYILSKFSDVEPEVPFTIATPDSSASSPKPFAVYAHITPHRFILLDTQLYIPSKQSLSPTTLLRRSKEVSLDPSTTSVYLETLNVQLCAWLLSVTDVCFFFHSQPTVPSDFLECFNKAKGIAQRMPFSMNSSVPVFIRNRVPISEYVPDFYQSFLLSTESTLLDDAKPLGLQLHTLFPSLLSTLTSSEEDPWVNHFWFPDFTLDPQLYPLSFEECLDYVQCKTYAMEKKRVQSEMDWVKLIIQAWDFLKRSEYMIKA